MAERHIQTVKKVIKKAMEDKSDIYLALLHYKNSGTELGLTPAQILMSRNLRSNIIFKESYYQPKIMKNVNQKIKNTDCTTEIL